MIQINTMNTTTNIVYTRCISEDKICSLEHKSLLNSVLRFLCIRKEFIYNVNNFSKSEIDNCVPIIRTDLIKKDISEYNKKESTNYPKENCPLYTGSMLYYSFKKKSEYVGILTMTFEYTHDQSLFTYKCFLHNKSKKGNSSNSFVSKLLSLGNSNKKPIFMEQV
jgi:hypothetical protein